MADYFPRVGMRMIKTAIAVAICFFISYMTGVDRIPIFAAIAALICMQPFVDHSLEVAVNRIIGTLIGAGFGLIASSVIRLLPADNLSLYVMVKYIIISVAVIPVLYTTVLLKKPGASALAAVVLLSVTLSGDGAEPVVNAANRSIETIIGILVSLGVNVIHLPRRHENDILFVSSFDETIYFDKTEISPYSVFELNQLLKDGIAFTFATERTPATFMADAGKLHLDLPVIAMDGAVLYDLKERRYLACQGISKELTELIEKKLTEMDLHYFLNVVWQDVLLIYYKDFKNEAEKELYEKMRLSPHRNYVYGERPEDGEVVYILLVLPDEKADEVTKRLRETDTEGELHFLRDKSETPPDYCHLKIYHKDATKGHMMARLLEYLPQKKTAVFAGNVNDLSMMKTATISFATATAPDEVKKKASYELKPSADSVVHTISRLYEPLPWRKRPGELQKNRKGE